MFSLAAQPDPQPYPSRGRSGRSSALAVPGLDARLLSRAPLRRHGHTPAPHSMARPRRSSRRGRRRARAQPGDPARPVHSSTRSVSDYLSTLCRRRRMTAATSVTFPTGRALAACWRELASRYQPRALWLHHLVLHRLETLVELGEPARLDPLQLLLLKTVARPNRWGQGSGVRGQEGGAAGSL